MQLDFWQLSRDPLERVVALVAARTRQAGERLLVVDADPARRAGFGKAMWDSDPQAFLANGEASGPHAARQPILLSDTCEAANGARFCVLADGDWRAEAGGFERVFLLFGEAGTPAARATWRAFDGREDVTRAYFAQEDGKWVKKA
ncbi:DNA polymerase III subunit chi [Tsuneonella mangrovi]|uniref:DNA polymerase III subunit chi n=1 Tax=Tsuneonella mangrovi TaxID=1982042 RepID=UPI000BA2B4EE|nr:DNA polymerase III subunit chi [Tsuneonella mangrovi]